MSGWVPEWARSYKFSPFTGTVKTLEIIFSEWDAEGELCEFKPINQLPHDLAAPGMQQQIRENPLSSRIDGLHYDDMKKPQHYQIRTSAITVVPEGESVVSDMATHVKIEDGGAGEFVSVEQNRTDYRASINPEEWEALQIAITDMIGGCRK